jgi:ABC-2 type transport system ATP-binding protein
VTHNVIEAERSVDRLAILDEGRVVAEGTPASLKAVLGAELRLELTLDPAVSEAPASPFGRTAVRIGHRLIVGVPVDAAGQAVAWVESLQRAGAVEEFTLGPATLEDVYVALAGGDPRATEFEEAYDVSAA